MTIPATAVNENFSDPGAAATPWGTTRQLLESAELFWIATVRADGRPHMTPLVAVWLEDALYFCTGETEQKAANLRGNQQVVLLTGCNRWDSGTDVVVEGRAMRVTDRGMLERLAESWKHKWDGRWEYESGDDGFIGDDMGSIHVFSVHPDNVFAFAKGNFSHTRHTF